jgi:hypothetical protein
METEWITSLIIGLGSLFISLGSTLAIVSFKTGQYKQKILDMEAKLGSKADLNDITAIKESLAEIKGMFVLRLRNE